MWLTTPDLNTKFFHLSTIVRRRRNTIDALCDSHGNWMEGRDTIGTHMIDHFRPLFACHYPLYLRGLQGVVPWLVHPEDNVMLCCTSSEAEFRNAVRSIGLRSPSGRMASPLSLTSTIGRQLSGKLLVCSRYYSPLAFF